MSEPALFGPTIPEVIEQCRIAFDTHYGTINIVHFDDHGIPRRGSKDKSAEFLHSLGEWFKFYSTRNKSSTLKIETAQGKGFVIALVPISQHKVKIGWFLLYMEKEGWKNSSGEYWKDGKRFDVDGDKVTVTKNVTRTDETSLAFNAPKDELQVKVMLELLR